LREGETRFEQLAERMSRSDVCRAILSIWPGLVRAEDGGAARQRSLGRRDQPQRSTGLSTSIAAMAANESRGSRPERVTPAADRQRRWGLLQKGCR